MDLATRLQHLEQLIAEAKSMPLSASVLLNRDEVLQLVAEMREALPEEIKQARWVVRDREELVTKARREAEAIVEQAREEQRRMASKEEVALASEEEADRILEEARDEARQIRLEAEDYVDAKLAQFEVALRRIQDGAAEALKAMGRTLDQVEVGREKLRGGGPAAELAQEADAEPAPPEPFDELAGSPEGSGAG